MYAANSAKLFEVKMGDDWMPTGSGKGRYVRAGEEIANTGPGVLALITTPKHVVIGRVDERGAAKSTVMIFDRATKAKLSETSFPARIVANGLATAGGRLYVTLENGEIAIIGG